MKKIYLSLSLLITSLFITSLSFAANHTVLINASSFSPDTMTVVVGDSVTWQWQGGTHTTTAFSAPANAVMWDDTLNQTHTTFVYVVVEPGTYDYVCTVHGFTGQFVATGTSGINTLQNGTNFNVVTVRPSVFNVSYNVTNASNVKVTLYDITGKNVRVLASNTQTSGEYTETYYLNDLMKGIYLIEMVANNERYTKRIIVE